MARQISLRGLNGTVKGKAWTAKDLLRIGRLDPLEVILNDTSVSRYHAEIRITERGWRLRDLGSTNGARLNGVRLGAGQWPLSERDLIQCGDVAFVVESITLPDPSVISTAWWGKVRIAQPVRYRSLTVFPLFREENPTVDYLLSDQAVEEKLLTVQEVSQEGRVAELSVENRGNARVLLLEGEALRGAKQNRILNTSVLVPPRSSIKI